MTTMTQRFAGARLLVVDDEPAQMKALCDTLELKGYHPTGFSSATQALATLQPGEYELLLTDLMMPAIDGIELLSSARALDPDLTAIVMTGHGTIDTAVTAMQVGAVDYVLKPFKPNAIVTAIERALEIRQLRLDNATLQRREREHAASLAAAYQDLESFSYSISHDLRSPLRTVRGFADLCLGEFGAMLPDPGRDYLAHIVSGAARMDRLIEDLLRFSRFSQKPVSRCPVDMSALVHKIVAERQAAEPARAVTVDIADLPACEADPSLIEQVWINLLSNAFKFTRQRTDPQVSVGSFTRAAPAPPHATETVYFVRDNGAGFDMKYAEQLFGVFRRLHAQSEFEGTGVGLSIVQRIVQRHGGRIWAESSPGHGATFFFVLAGARG